MVIRISYDIIHTVWSGLSNKIIMTYLRTIFTPILNILNRRTYEINKEDKANDPSSAVSGRKTESRRTKQWSKGQRNPYVFICTTLWHEEEVEMATLMTSVSKLLRRARDKKLDPKDEDGYDLEMHIFFDNVFEKKKREPNETEGVYAEERIELNVYVKLRVFFLCSGLKSFLFNLKVRSSKTT